MLSFLHPWVLALGAAAAALPVVVHLLTRPRPVRMPLSTIRFVTEAIRQQRARHRLRDFIVLALRTLAILLVATAVARPQWSRQSLVSDRDGGDAVRVVVIDVSQSMAAMHAGLENIERARTTAATYLRYRPGLRANLIQAGATPRIVFGTVSTNFDALSDALARCRALPERLNLNRSLERAAEMLAPGGPGDKRRRELVVVSDFQRSSWADADFGVLPADAVIQLVSVAPRPTLNNLALVRAEFRGRTSQDQGSALEVEVGNYSESTRRATVEVIVGSATYRLQGVCPAGRRTVLSESVQLRDVGWQTGSARLIGNEDSLSADDVRPLVTEVRRKPLYALVTRQPANRRPSSSHYLQCALVPDETLGPRAAAQLVRIDPAVVDRESLAPADLIVLDHPGKLSEGTIGLLAGLMRRGRPILYVTDDAVDAVNLKQLVEMAGGGSQMPVEFAPPPAASRRSELFLASVERQRRPFRVFGDGIGELMRQLRFSGGLSSRRLESGLADDVLATYQDGTACLVLTSFGGATLGVINADLAASNLARTGALVPLVEELVSEMLSRGSAAEGALCGEPLVRRLPAEVTSSAGLRIVGPGEPTGPSAASPAVKPARALLSANSTVAGQVAARAGDSQRWGKLEDDATGVVWKWTAPDLPGAYRIERAGECVFAATVGIPADESRLEYLSPEVLTQRLGHGRNISYLSTAGSGEPRDDTWSWLLAGCVLCAIAEIGALAGFRT